MSNDCPVCRQPASVRSVGKPEDDIYTVQCKVCREYDISGTARAEMEKTEQDDPIRQSALQVAREWHQRNPGNRPRPFIQESIKTMH